jgi:hypothetical protein
MRSAKENNLITGSLRSSFKNMVWVLRRALLDKRSFVILRNPHRRNHIMIRELHSAGVIESFERKGHYLFIKLPAAPLSGGRLQNQAQDAVSNALSALPVPRHGALAYSAKDIQKYQRYSGGQVLGFFNTDLGLVDGSKAASRQVGGVPLFQIR